MNAVVELKHGTALALQEADLMNVLQSSLYPGAAADSIRMVISYCRAAGLDPMQKPVHIVPMWDRDAGRMRDVIMPGINLYRIQASRTGQCAGISEPEYGPMVTTTLSGQDVLHPEWCRVTVRRQLASGVIGEYTAREHWIENYAVKGGKEKSIAPNAMWSKRPRGQIAKCAEAQALRKAFPEIAAQYTAEEMEGKDLHPGDESAGGPPDAEARRRTWINDQKANIAEARNVRELKQVMDYALKKVRENDDQEAEDELMEASTAKVASAKPKPEGAAS